MRLIIWRSILTFFFSSFFVYTPAIADERDHEQTRRVETQSFSFQIDVPVWFQLTLNERLRGTAFLTIQGTAVDGQVIPATLSVIYSEPEAGDTYPQLPEPEAYSQLFTAMLRGNGVEFDFLRAERCELDGYNGILVEYTQQQGDVTIRTIQMNVVPADGSERFILTYGSFEEHVEVDIPFLESIVETIKLGRGREIDQPNQD